MISDEQKNSIFLLENNLVKRILHEMMQIKPKHLVNGAYIIDEDQYYIFCSKFNEEYITVLENYDIHNYEVKPDTAWTVIKFKVDLLELLYNHFFEMHRTFDGVHVCVCGVHFGLYNDSTVDVERYSGRSMFTFHKKIDVLAFKEEEQETLRFHRTLIIKLLSSCDSLKNCLFNI
ncbi:hypothetical protein PXD04_10235 [Methanosphaera sp. ISO3-F5]|uniref:hypothetical protein n=1 Tax=Methanosphaera sp. ISO3-F5 TaxID=1452353 RepID=UPI002B25FD07|nr:hypothetical protein [Methanosphaera sp. ISO3-F5]WQH64068.1 hypothetical protein PXD04_10235 [Methanosphaera sp. ISO3-F5]